MPITSRVADVIFSEKNDIASPDFLGGSFSEFSDKNFPENSDLKKLSENSDRKGIPVFSGGEQKRGLLSAAEAAAASCPNGHSFFVTSSALPDSEGCYVAVEGTSFGEGFVYDLSDGLQDRNIYPKVITTEGESEVSV